MLKICICDDKKSDLEIMEKCIKKVFSEFDTDCVIQRFSDGSSLLEAHNAEPFDVYFLDISMPERDGFDIAKQIRTSSDNCVILFVTSHDELVYDSFDYRPFQFVRKGSSKTIENSLTMAVRKLINYFRQNALLHLDLGVSEYRVILYKDIIYIKSNLHYLSYHLANGEEIRVRKQIADVLKTMSEHGFLRSHQRYLVNSTHIKTLCASRYPKIILKNGKEIPLSKTYKETAAEEYKKQARNSL